MADLHFTYKGKDRSIPIEIPDEHKNDQSFLEKTIDDYIGAHPEFGNEASAKKGSLKAGISPPGGGILNTIASTLGTPIKSIMDRYASYGNPENTDPATGKDTRPMYRQLLGGAEDTIASGVDLLAAPGLIRGGVKGLWPAAKAVAGYTAGSKAAEAGADAIGAPPEVSKGLGMLAGTGAGLLTSSPKVAAKAQAGIQASKDVPIGKYSSIGALAGYGAGTGAGHALGVPLPQYIAGPVGAAVGGKMAPFMKGLSTPNSEPLIDSLFSGPKEVPSVREPLWKGSPETVNNTLDIKPIKSDLPSGRVPGKPVEKPVKEPRVSLPTQYNTKAEPPTSQPKVEPIKSELPSGRKVGTKEPTLTKEKPIETKSEPASSKAEDPKIENKEAPPTKSNSEKLKSTKSAEMTLNHNLAIADPTWDGEQVSYAHLKKAADLTGATATALGRKLQDLGYDVEPVARGYGLRPGKKDISKE